MLQILTYLASDCDNENKCITLINELKTTKEIFLGEFIKAILKINNIAKELNISIVKTNKINAGVIKKIRKVIEKNFSHIL